MGLSKIVEDLPEHYGYVVLVGAGSTFLNMWMGINVGMARKKYEVPYPTMYSQDNKMFNCIQRAHQNTLESHPTFLMLLLVGGLQYPKACAGFGLVYIISRIAYAKGYYTGEPDNRRWGAFGHLAELGMLGAVLGLAVRQLKWLPFE